MQIKSIKSKICIGALGAIVVVLAIFGICRLVSVVSAATSAGVRALVQSKSNNVVYGSWNTNQYTVVTDSGHNAITTHAMCAQPQKQYVVGGVGTVEQLDTTTWGPVIKIILATDSQYGSLAYSSMYTYLNGVAGSISSMSPSSGASAIFAIGHMILGSMTGDYTGLSSADRTLIDNAKDYIWNNYTWNDWESYYLMRLVPDQVYPIGDYISGVSASQYQTVVWLEPNSGSVDPGPGPDPDPDTGIVINKYDSDTHEGLSGAGFYLAKYADKEAGNTSAYQYVTTGSGGSYSITPSESAVWCVQEVTAPSGYDISPVYQNNYWNCKLVEINGGDGVVEYNFYDPKKTVTPTTGTIKIYKEDENGNGLTGAKFYLATEDDKNNNNTSNYQTIDMTSLTETTISNVSADTWCLIETQAPSGYQKGDYASWQCYGLSAGGTLSFHVENTPIPTVSGSVTIKKIDADTGTTTPSGAASLAGTVFQVQKCTSASSCTNYNTMTIGSDGTAILTGLPEGDYKVYEKTAGTGYVSNSSDVRTFSITSTNNNIDLTGSPFSNTVTKGKIEIIKQRTVKEDVNNVATNKTESFGGVTFYVCYGNNVSNCGENNYDDKITTDSQGVATTKDLPYGTYTIVEKEDNVNVAFIIAANQTKTISTNGEVVEATFTNALKDNPTLETVAREANSSASNPVKELGITTNASIKDVVTFGSQLTTGRSYKLCGSVYDVSARTLLTSQPVCETWIQASETNKEIIFTDINTTNLSGNSVAVVQKLYIINNGEDLLLTIHNGNLDVTDETLTVKGGSVKIKKVDAENGGNANAETNLSGAEFRLDRCTSADTDDCDASDASVWTPWRSGIALESNLEATVYSLPEGHYMIYETSAGAGYIASNVKKEFDIPNNNGDYDIDLTSQPFANTVIKGKIKITKKRTIKEEENNVITINDDDPFGGVTFYVCYGNNVSNCNEASGSYIESVTTGSQASDKGIAITSDLPYGTYTIVEKENSINAAFNKVANTVKTISTNGEIVEVELMNTLKNNPSLETVAREANSSASNPVKELGVTTSASIIDRVIYGDALTTGLNYKVCGEVYRVSPKMLLTPSPSCTEWEQGVQTEVEVRFDNIDTTQVIDGSVSIIQKLYVINNGEPLLLTVHNAGLDVAAETLTVKGPTVATEAWRYGAIGESRFIYVNTSAMVSDVVKMTGLEPNMNYTLKGEIYALNINNGIVTLGSKVAEKSQNFTTGTTVGAETSRTIDFVVDTTNLIGKKLVVYEYLYVGDVLVGWHTEPADSDQTVTVMTPIIETTAVNANAMDEREEGVIEAKSGQVIKDTVRYENLEPGVDYYLCGILMDKNTGNVLKINDVEVSEKCEVKTAMAETGTFTMTFNVDASKLPGKSIVVFESLHDVIYTGLPPLDPEEDSGDGILVGLKIAEHKDLGDKNQTVKVKSRIGTKAVDEYDGDQEVGVGDATIVDTVAYEGLEEGIYIVRGKLMDVGTTVKETGVETEERLVINSSDLANGLASGEVEIKFEINTKEYAGHKLVVFEELYLIAEPDVLIAEHKNKDDEEQTVTVTEPKIETMATDALDEDKELSPNANVKIKDRVAYEGLVPGTVYTLKGVLMDKKTGEVLLLGNLREAEEVTMVFTAGRDDGVVRMEFEIPTATLSGREIVVFETLYIGEEDATGTKLADEDIIAVHHDINDEDQTVTVGTTPRVPNTGSMEHDRSGAYGGVVVIAIAMSGAVITLIAVSIKKRKVDFANCK